MNKIKEKIGYYKTLITLFWTAFIILSGGSYTVYSKGEKPLFYICLFGIIVLLIPIGGLMARTKYWINKIKD